MADASTGAPDDFEAARRTICVTAPAVLSFLLATVLLVFISRAFNVDIDMARWHLSISLALAFSLFSVWLSLRLEAAETISYPLAALVLAIGTLTSLGAFAANAGFALADGEHAVSTRSVLGLFLSQAVPARADAIFLATTIGLTGLSCLVCLGAARTLPRRSEELRKLGAPLYLLATALWLSEVLLQEWLRATTGRASGVDLIWLAPLSVGFLALIGLFWITSQRAAAMASALAALLSQTGASARTAGVVAAGVFLGVLSGTALALLIAGAIIALFGLAGLALGALPNLQGILSLSAYLASRAAPAFLIGLATAGSAFVVAWLVWAAPWTPRAESATVDPARASDPRTQALAPLLLFLGSRQAVLGLACALVAIIAGAGLLAVSPLYGEISEQLAGAVRRLIRLELQPLYSLGQRVAFIVLVASLAVMVIAAMLAGSVIVAAALFALVADVAARSGIVVSEGSHLIVRKFDETARVARAITHAVGELLLWLLAPFWAVFARLCLGSAILLGAALLLLLAARAYELAATVWPSTLSLDASLLQVQLYHIAAGAAASLCAALLYLLRGRLAEALRTLAKPLWRSTLHVLLTAIALAGLAVLMPVYTILLGVFVTLVDTLLAFDPAPLLVAASHLLAPLPATLGRFLLALAMLLSVALSAWGGFAILAILASATGASLTIVARFTLELIKRALDPLLRALESAARAVRAALSSLGAHLPGLAKPVVLFTAVAMALYFALRLTSPISTFLETLRGIAPLLLALVFGAALVVCAWTLRRAVLRTLPRMTATAAVIALLAGISLHRGTAPPLPPPPLHETEITLSNVLSLGAAPWSFASARALGAQDIRSTQLDPNALCSAQVVIAVGAASSDGDASFNRALARCRGSRLAALAAEQLHACTISPAIWVLNLGPRNTTSASRADRAPFVLALSGVSGGLSQENIEEAFWGDAERLRNVTGGRTLDDYALRDWSAWPTDPQSAASHEALLAACSTLED